LQDRREIHHGLPRLLDHVVGDHLASLGIEPTHAGHEYPGPDYGGVRERAGSGRSFWRVDELVGRHHASPCGCAPIHSRSALAVRKPERRSIRCPLRNRSSVGTPWMLCFTAKSTRRSASTLWARTAPPEPSATAATIGSTLRQITQACV